MAGAVVTSHRITALMITLPFFFTAFIYICQSEEEKKPVSQSEKYEQALPEPIRFEYLGPTEWV